MIQIRVRITTQYGQQVLHSRQAAEAARWTLTEILSVFGKGRTSTLAGEEVSWNVQFNAVQQLG